MNITAAGIRMVEDPQRFFALEFWGQVMMLLLYMARGGDPWDEEDITDLAHRILTMGLDRRGVARLRWRAIRETLMLAEFDPRVIQPVSREESVGSSSSSGPRSDSSSRLRSA